MNKWLQRTAGTVGLAFGLGMLAAGTASAVSIPFEGTSPLGEVPHLVGTASDLSGHPLTGDGLDAGTGTIGKLAPGLGGPLEHQPGGPTAEIESLPSHLALDSAFERLVPRDELPVPQTAPLLDSAPLRPLASPEVRRTEALPVVDNLPAVGGMTNGLPVGTDSVDNLPVVGGVTQNLPVNSLPVVGGAAKGLTGKAKAKTDAAADTKVNESIPVVGGLPMVGGMTDQVPLVGGMDTLPLVGGLTEPVTGGTEPVKAKNKTKVDTKTDTKVNEGLPLVGGLPVVGGVANQVPFVGGVADGLPVVGGGDNNGMGMTIPMPGSK